VAEAKIASAEFSVGRATLVDQTARAGIRSHSVGALGRKSCYVVIFGSWWLSPLMTCQVWANLLHSFFMKYKISLRQASEDAFLHRLFYSVLAVSAFNSAFYFYLDHSSWSRLSGFILCPWLQVTSGCTSTRRCSRTRSRSTCTRATSSGPRAA
jgi:hypothetical protein